MLTAGRNGTLFLAGAAITLVLAIALPAQAVNPEAAPPRPERQIEFYGWWHDAGQLWLHVSNLVFFGTWGSTPEEPSASWPLDSGYEHLYAAGLWVGAVSGGDTLVSSAVYQQEFFPPINDPLYTIYSSSSGSPGGDRYVDDDLDGAIDEDRLDGLDNDGDLLVDEDFAAISEEMFACVAFDTVAIPNPDPNYPHTPLGIEAYVQSYAWSDSRADDFVGARYEISNVGSEILTDVYLGLMVDADVGLADDSIMYFADDLVGYVDVMVSPVPEAEPVRVIMAHVHDAPGGEDGDWNGWFGVALLDHTNTGDTVPELHAYHRWFSGQDDPRGDDDRYAYLSEGVIQPDSDTPADWRFLFTIGPFDEFSPGETAFLEVAYVCGEGLDDLVANATKAVMRHRSRLWGGVAGPAPKVPDAALPRHASESDARGHLTLSTPTPNPAGGSALVSFYLAETCKARLSVHDCSGRRVAVLVDEELSAGSHRVDWADGIESLPSGIYFVRLVAGQRTSTTKLVLVH